MFHLNLHIGCKIWVLLISNYIMEFIPKQNVHQLSKDNNREKTDVKLNCPGLDLQTILIVFPFHPEQ